MKVLGVIPARGGSKRVPKKNVKLLGGKPLIQYTIEAAKNSNLLTDFLVSTDCEEVAQVAKTAGANVPFIRPSSLATDAAGDREVLIHALSFYQKEGEKIDAVCYLRPTSPFKTSKIIDAAISQLAGSEFDSIRTVTQVEGVHHPYWMFKKENGIVEPAVPGVSIAEYHQSQLLPPVYRLNGVVDIIKVDALLNQNAPLYGLKMDVLEIDESVSHDIDTHADFEYCEWLMSRKPQV